MVKNPPASAGDMGSIPGQPEQPKTNKGLNIFKKRKIKHHGRKRKVTPPQIPKRVRRFRAWLLGGK